MQCSSCGQQNDRGAGVCSRCGAGLVRRCPSCDAEVPARFAFCGDCGTRFTESAERPVERGDRRVVTALFSDLSGFTSLAEQLDPEDLTNLINECFSGLVEEVRLRGGWLEKQIGDALVAIFGAPLVHEDDPMRSVDAALAMRERMRGHNERLGPQLGRPLELHIGINTGLVVMGPGLETGEGDELVVLGDTVNVAARLQQAAGADQILVGELTHALTSWAFDYRKLPRLTVKGKAEPLTAYECLGARAGRRRAPGKAATAGSPLVGRDREIALLREQGERVLAGKGGIVTIVGEPGIGKSRLVAEAIRARPPEELRWLEGRTLAYGQTIAYLPFIEIVKSDAGITEEDGEAQSWSKLERRVRSLFADQVPEILPYLATLLALDVVEELAERVVYLDGEAMRLQIFRASRLYVERLARERPTVLVFEDFHWADASSAALLEHLLPLVVSAPLLVCCLTRPDPESPGGLFRELARRDYAGCSSEIVLSQLSAEDSARLVQQLLDIEPSPRLQPLFRKTDGNPLFLEEVVRSLIDMGAIVRDEESGRFRISTRIGEITIPDTIQGVIMARVDRLDEEAKQVLKTASVIGRTFPYRVLSALTAPEANGKLDRCLADLQAHELIREQKHRLEAELEFIFKHALTQEAVYGSILMRQRRELHGRAARCMEELYAERPEELYAVLAYHYAQAEDWEKAQDYLMRAGDHAGQMAADTEALTHYEQALTAYARAFGERWDPFERAVLERKMGEALFRRGENEHARARLERALAYLGRPYPETRRGVRRAIGRNLARQVAHRRLPSLFLRGRPAPPDETVKELVRIYGTLSWIDILLDGERLFLDSLLETNLSERSGYEEGIIGGLVGLAFAYDYLARYGVAERYHRRAVALADETEHPATIRVVHFGLGFHALRLARWDDAIEHLERATEQAARAGEIRKWAAPASLVARIWLLQGRVAPAMERYHELIRVGRDAGDHQSLGWGYFRLGQALAYVGELEEAEQHLMKAIPLFEGVPDYASVAAASGELAHVHVLQGRLDEALSLLAVANRLVDERKLRFLMIEVRVATAEAYLSAAELADGQERAEWLRKAKRACEQAIAQTKWDREGEPAAYRLQARYWWLAGAESKARNWWRRALAAAEELKEPYELARTALEYGQLTGETAEAERGESMLGELRAKYEAEAKVLLGTVAAQGQEENDERGTSSPAVPSTAGAASASVETVRSRPS